MLQIHFSNQLGFQMAGNVFHHLLRLPADFFARRHTGDLVSRFGALREIRQAFAEELLTVVLDGIFALAALLAMFYFHAVLASVVMLFVILEAALRLGVTPLLRRLSEQRIVAEAQTSTGLMESMRAIEIIKFYCCELARIASWRNHHAEQVNAQVQVSRVLVRVETAYGLLNGIEHVLVIYLAALAVMEGSITVGFLTAFIALKGHFSTSIRAFIDKLVQMRLLRLQLERVSDITCAEPEFADFLLPQVRSLTKGCLQVRDLAYSYPGAPAPVFAQLSLDILPGEILAITGASGSGKSTLVRILAGLLRPDEGQVLADGQSLTGANARRFRDVCSGVLQGEQLLSGTLLENITLFAETVDYPRMQRACRMARIDAFIASLPMGFNSLVGDMGAIMSAGQGQRVLLARAFYKQPRILFLDEATANLDPVVEGEILQEIKALGVTTVMVTHRAAPLNVATRVVHLEGGRLR
jgi:ATP-binding cassette subfamily B protein RaxB